MSLNRKLGDRGFRRESGTIGAKCHKTPRNPCEWARFGIEFLDNGGQFLSAWRTEELAHLLICKDRAWRSKQGSGGAVSPLDDEIFVEFENGVHCAFEKTRESLFAFANFG